MATTANLGTILRWYANKINNAFILYKDFVEYIKKYSAHHLEEQPGLVVYLDRTEESLNAELKKLAAKKEVYLLNLGSQKSIIIITSYYSVLFANKYKEIVNNSTIPFPVLSDLPKQLPPTVIERIEADSIIPELIEQQELSSPVLYGLTLPKDVPPLLFPACVPVQYLLTASINKIKVILKKEEYHDYFQKKLKVANPGKELTSQTFFNKFVVSQEQINLDEDFKSENFYFLTQLLYFLRQDFEKIKDRTPEDINILQALWICEIFITSKKQKAQDLERKEHALNELKLALSKPPYFYSMDSILKLKDSKGTLLYGQYSEEDLKELLRKMSTESINSELPELLIFKIESGKRFFIYKEKVFQLIIRLAKEAHEAVEKSLTNKWIKCLLKYEKLPEMRDSNAFEITLEKEVKALSPVLYSLLNANFLTLLHYEKEHSDDEKNFKVFENGHLVPYSTLLLLKNTSILNKAKSMLPFWYTIPIISWIIGLFSKKPEKNVPKTRNREQAEETLPKTQNTRMSKREALQAASKDVINELIPEGSTIDRELDSYLKQWNRMITKEAFNTLTEDVNCLIRDYMRKVIKTISVQTFTRSRVQSLAETLVKTPNMQKIKDQEELLMYVELFILKLVSNG